MSTIVTRAGKGSPLTFDEMDSNFINLNTDKIQSGDTVAALTITNAAITNGTVGGAAITTATNTQTLSGKTLNTPIVSGGTVLLGGGGEGGQINFNNADNLSTGMIIDVASANVGRIFSIINDFTLQLGQLAGTNGNVQLYTAGSERMRIDANGNVGIGTTNTNPVVAGRNLALNSVSGTSSWSLSSAGTLGMYGYSDGTSGAIAVFPSGPLTFLTNNTEKMRITSAGNVGIGTSTPFGRFDVMGVAGDITVFTVQSADGSMSRINLANTTRNWTISNYGSQFSPNGSLVIADEQAAAIRLLIDTSGNVGIGTATPNASALLDVQSTTKGVRMPNMTTAEKNAISSPAAGLMVFDTTLAKLCVYTGAAWQTITST